MNNDCLHTDLVDENGFMVCIDCGLELDENPDNAVAIPYDQDYEVKYGYYYKRESNFSKIIDRYQANESFYILPSDLNHFKQKFLNKKITNKMIFNEIRKLHKSDKKKKHNRNYSHVNYIRFILTNYRPEKISDIESLLLEQFNLLINNFIDLRIDKKNFVSYQLVLFVLLKINGKNPIESDFKFLKNVETRKSHEELLKILLDNVGLKYNDNMFPRYD